MVPHPLAGRGTKWAQLSVDGRKPCTFVSVLLEKRALYQPYRTIFLRGRNILFFL
jgi:hypothetical protein